MPHWTTCEDCNRVLLIEDGPVCPGCEAKREAAELAKETASNWELEIEDDECASS